MRIIDQSYELKLLADFPSQAKLIEFCGRTAYQSEDAITESSAPTFIKMIGDKNHKAVLEHSIMTVRFITTRGVSHEIVRHRIASFTQESTRYCNYSKGKYDKQITFIRPTGVRADVLGDWQGTIPDIADDDTGDLEWVMAMNDAEGHYMRLTDKGWKAQRARGVLPNDLKTSIAMTANFREWLHFFQLRAVEKTAHPDMRALTIPLYEECRARAPYLFDLGDPQ